MPTILGCAPSPMLGRVSIPAGWLRRLAAVPVSPVSGNRLVLTRGFSSPRQQKSFQAASHVAAPKAISWLTQTPRSVVSIICYRISYSGANQIRHPRILSHSTLSSRAPSAPNPLFLSFSLRRHSRHGLILRLLCSRAGRTHYSGRSKKVRVRRPST
jgi:hypothetical protein